MKRLAILLAGTVLLLAACGGSGGSGGNDAQSQIKSAYTTFFAPGTSLQDRIAVLQDGSKFKPVVQSFASNPLAKHVSVTVSSVMMQGANAAKVIYTVKVGGTSLSKLDGTAIKQNGTWKIGYQGLCNLVSLGGTAPKQCTK
jgi:hypothetical protein